MSDAAAQRRARQTVTNLVIALGACLALVAVIYLIAPHSEQSLIKKVDYQSIATEATTANFKVLAPELPAGWWCNNAVFDSSTGYGPDAIWKVGFVGPKNEFVGISQTWVAGDFWTRLELQNHRLTRTLSLGGNKWQLWDSKSTHDPIQMKDHQFVLSLNGQLIQVYGTASPSQFNQFLKAINARL